MAGAGFKTFNTGDVLTASDVNTYLMQQTVMVFADASARSTALGANVAEGMVSYLKDTNAVERYDGSSWGAIGAGDITEVTAGTGLTGGGTSGAVSLAFDVANYGGGQRAAGKNFVINGGFDIWQRGTSSSATAGGYYTADRYYTTGGGTVTFSQQTDVPTGVVSQYSMRWLTGAATSYGQFYTALDSATIKPLRGQSVVFSYYIKTGGSHSGNILTEVFYSNSTDALISQTTNVNPSGDTSYAASGVTSWTRKSVTFTIPSDAVGLRLAVLPNATQASGVSELTTGWQLEIGSTATPFSRAGGTLQGELAACQRYYWNMSGANTYVGVGYYQSATEVNVGIPFPVIMRTAPTGTVTTGTNYYNIKANGVNDNFNDLSTTASFLSTNGGMLYTTSNVSGNAGQAGTVSIINASGKIEFSAEL